MSFQSKFSLLFFCLHINSSDQCHFLLLSNPTSKHINFVQVIGYAPIHILRPGFWIQVQKDSERDSKFERIFIWCLAVSEFIPRRLGGKDLFIFVQISIVCPVFDPEGEAVNKTNVVQQQLLYPN